ncbi:MAG: DUF4149 domain-containing protein [Deltaproteobacteria bacterium]|nr:DUF4149 domain-containing protein [Deltaproteobacteria bacterium]
MQENATGPGRTGTSDGAAAIAVFVTALALWIGTAAFFSAVVLPVLFTHLAANEAGAIAALLFPWYFRVGCVLGIVALAVALHLARGAGKAWRFGTLVLALMTAAQLYSTVVVHPEVARLRGDRDQAQRFAQLHQLSVRLNAVVLGGGMLLLCGSGLLLSRRERRS